MRVKDVMLGAAVLAFVLSVPAGGSAAEADPPDRMNDCAKIADEAERLKCFDELSGRSPAESLEVPKGVIEEPAEKEAPSYLSRLWELDKESRREKFPITPYRSNYILPVTYNNTPNEDPIQEADPDKEVQNYEVKFQISFKIKLWQDVLGKNMDLWVGYTQL
ncbi:MAG: phospholipase A, partial [Desulfobacteraceae bacterium]